MDSLQNPPEENWELLREKAKRLPKEPGVYLMRGKDKNVIYVGKARNLNHRVRSYFSPNTSDTRAFVARLETLLDSFEVILTENEKEALLLENELIKEHKPRFNVLLKDDKNFLLLAINPDEDYPWIQVVRKRNIKGARYFGPYASSSAIRETLRVLNRHFLLRTCTDKVLLNRKRVCLEYQIRRCLGPCVYQIDQDLYRSQVKDVILFLEGKEKELVKSLRQRMNEAALEQRFEVAAHYRDQVQAIETSLERQRVVLRTKADCDAIGLYREGVILEIHVLSFREGKLLGSRTFSLQDKEAPTPEVLSSFLAQYYAKATELPEQILLSSKLSEGEEKIFSTWLSERRGKKVEVLLPKRGEKKALVSLAQKNAKAAFEERAIAEGTREKTLERIARRLQLSRVPNRIECYDISNFQGSQSVGSMVVFTQGNPDRSQYRRFKMKGEYHGKHDDFRMMHEVLARRFRRGVSGDKKFANALPDLLVVDGGKGQLNMALEVLKELKISEVSAVSIAKERVLERKDKSARHVQDRVYLPGVKNAIPIRSESSELFLLARCRDEAHRVAIEYHRKLRSKKTIRSQLDDIPGIGPKRRKLLLSHFGSVERVTKAKKEEIANLLQISIEKAEDILKHLPGS